MVLHRDGIMTSKLVIRHADGTVFHESTMEHGEGNPVDEMLGVSRPPLPPSPQDDRIERGRKAWHWLHTEALKGGLTSENLQKKFPLMIPRFGCSCLREWNAIVAGIPFRPGDQFNWSVDVHNAVNQKVPDKLQVSYDEARSIWA
jgi:hypothetical protein